MEAEQVQIDSTGAINLKVKNIEDLIANRILDDTIQKVVHSFINNLLTVTIIFLEHILLLFLFQTQ